MGTLPSLRDVFGRLKKLLRPDSVYVDERPSTYPTRLDPLDPRGDGTIRPGDELYALLQQARLDGTAVGYITPDGEVGTVVAEDFEEYRDKRSGLLAHLSAEEVSFLHAMYQEHQQNGQQNA